MHPVQNYLISELRKLAEESTITRGSWVMVHGSNHAQDNSRASSGAYPRMSAPSISAARDLGGRPRTRNSRLATQIGGRRAD